MEGGARSANGYARWNLCDEFRAEADAACAWSFGDGNPARHVRVKLAVIVHDAFSLEHDALGGFDRDQNVPRAVRRGRRMSDEIGIDPFDRVADMGRDFCRHKAKFFHLDLNNVGTCGPPRKDEKERAERAPRCSSMHDAALFEFRRDVFGVLLVALKNLQAGRE